MHESTLLGEYLKWGYFIGIPLYFLFFRFVAAKEPQNVISLLSLAIIWPILVFGDLFEPIGDFLMDWEI